MQGKSERRLRLARLIEERERRERIDLLGPFVLGLPTLWIYPLILAVRALGSHLEEYREHAAWWPEPRARAAEQDAFLRCTERASDASGLPVGLAFAAVAILAAALELVRVGLLAAGGRDVRLVALGVTRTHDLIVLVLVGTSCLIGAALLVSLWWLYARLRRHEENALLAELLAEQAPVALARRRLEALRLRWLLIQTAAGAYTMLVIAAGGVTAVAIVPFFFAAPLVFYPLVLLWPLRSHLRRGCPGEAHGPA